LFKGNAAHNPERLEPCQTPQETLRVETPRPCVSTRPETPAHLFARPTPRRAVKGASAPAELDQPVTRTLRPERPPARDASSQLVHSTLSKTSTRTACGYRPAQGLPMRPPLHGFGLASTGLPGPRLGACHTEHTSQGPTSDALVTGRQPRLSPGPPSDQRRFCHRLVKDSGFHDTERLHQQATLLGPFVFRRVLPRDDHSRRLFALGSGPRARSPSAPPAATGSAYLDLAPLTDLCNQHRGRAH
jgi:hypothetical protein